MTQRSQGTDMYSIAAKATNTKGRSYTSPPSHGPQRLADYLHVLPTKVVTYKRNIKSLTVPDNALFFRMSKLADLPVTAAAVVSAHSVSPCVSWRQRRALSYSRRIDVQAATWDCRHTHLQKQLNIQNHLDST